MTLQTVPHTGSTYPHPYHWGARWRCHETLKFEDGAQEFTSTPGDGDAPARE